MRNIRWIYVFAALAAAGCAESDVLPTDERTETPVAETPGSPGTETPSNNGVIDDGSEDPTNPDIDLPGPDDQQECNAGATRPCYEGPAGTEGVGTCAPGQQVCEDGIWSACTGSVGPVMENPFDGLDNDCNDSVDETAPSDPALTGGHWHSCYLTAGQDVYCWGHNEWGQIGNGTTQNTSTPLKVYTPVLFEQIEAGYMFNCGLSQGQAYCWGENEHGQIGDGTTTDRWVPTKVNTPLVFKQVTAGDGHACGLQHNGEVACWGANDNAQITDPVRGAVIAWPYPVTTGVRFTTITAGQLHTCGLDEEGRAYCWGYNGHGQIGIGSTEIFVPTPSLVSDELRFTQISAGYRHTCGVTFERETWCWGRNPEGQLGDGTTNDSGVPVAVAGKLDMKQVFTGYFNTCGITTSDETFCWGQNWKGQLGDGTTDRKTVPTAVATSEAFVDLAMMVTTTCGRTGAGQLLCWGENDYGQFGTAAPGASNTPAAVAVLP